MSHTKEHLMEIRQAFMDDNDRMGDFYSDIEKEETIRVIARNKLVPVFNHPLDEETYYGIAEILEGPDHISKYADKEIGFCKVRFYDSKEVAGHWIALKYLKEKELENSRSPKKLEE